MTFFDNEHPLDRLPGEPRTANTALRDYYEMGVGRSLRGLVDQYRNNLQEKTQVNPPSLRLSTVFTWSTKYSWQERVDLMTGVDLKAANEAKRKALEEKAQRWVDRQNEVRERDWSQGEQLRELVDKLFEQTPDFITRKQKTIKGKNGEPDRIVITEKINQKLLLDGLLVSSKIQRLAAEMETEHVLDESTSSEELESIRKRRWHEAMEQLSELESENPVDVPPPADFDILSEESEEDIT